MKKIRKRYSIIIICLFIISFTGCGSKNQSESKEDNVPATIERCFENYENTLNAESYNLELTISRQEYADEYYKKIQYCTVNEEKYILTESLDEEKNYDTAEIGKYVNENYCIFMAANYENEYIFREPYTSHTGCGYFINSIAHWYSNYSGINDDVRYYSYFISGSSYEDFYDDIPEYVSIKEAVIKTDNDGDNSFIDSTEINANECTIVIDYTKLLEYLTENEIEDMSYEIENYDYSNYKFVLYFKLNGKYLSEFKHYFTAEDFEIPEGSYMKFTDINKLDKMCDAVKLYNNCLEKFDLTDEKILDN